MAGEGETVGGRAQKMSLAKNGEELKNGEDIKVIESHHNKHNGNMICFELGTWSGKLSIFGEKSDGGGGDKRVRYNGNVRGHKLAFISSGKSQNGVRIEFHWDKREV